MKKNKKYLVGSIRIDGIEPSEEFLRFAELERQGLLTKEDIKNFCNKPHKVKERFCDPDFTDTTAEEKKRIDAAIEEMANGVYFAEEDVCRGTPKCACCSDGKA